jgi:hypothetical protein
MAIGYGMINFRFTINLAGGGVSLLTALINKRLRSLEKNSRNKAKLGQNHSNRQ